MSKILIKSFKIIAIIIVSIIALMFILPFAFKGKIMELAQEQANSNLNATVRFDDISLSLFRSFPDLNIRINEISIAGKDTFINDTLFAAKYIDLGVNLMSAVSGNEIKLNTIALINPDIKVISLADGKANYDIAIEDSTAIDTTAAETSDEAPMKINLKKVTIENGNIIYDDKSLNMIADIKDINLNLKGDIVGDLSNLDLNTVIEKLTVDYDGVKYLNQVELSYDAKIQSDLKNMKFSFDENNMTINALAIKFSGFVEMPDTNIYTDIKFSALKNDFKSVLSLIPAIYSKDFEGVNTSGTFSMNGYAKGNYNDLSMPAFGIDLNIEKARFQYPDLPKSVENINIKMKVDAEEGTGDNMIIDIKKAHFEMAANPIDIIFFAKMTLADIDMSGTIKGKIDFTSVKDIMPIEDMTIKGIANADIQFKGKMSDIDNEDYEKFYAEGNLMLKDFEYISSDMPKFDIIKAEMFFSPQFIDLKSFNARTPKSDFKLNGKIYNAFAYAFKNEMLKGEFNFNSNYIDVDEFMGEETSTDENTTSEAANSSEAQSEAVQIPENIDFILNSKLKKVKYDNIEIKNIKGKIIAKNGIAKLDKITMQLLGGTTEINGSYSAKSIKEPKANFSLLFKNFDIPQLYKSFVTIKKIAPITEYCTGKINGNISFNTTLDSEMMPVYNTMNSNGEFDSRNIGIKNNKLFKTIAEKTKYKEFANPVLKDVKISYIMKNGNITVKPTTFKLAGIKTGFGGTQNLDGAIDYKIDMELPSKYATNVIANLPSTPKSINITANIGGTVENPKITGFKSNLTDGLKDQALETLEKYTGVNKEKAKEILDKAQKQADAIIETAKKQADKIKNEADRAGKLLISEAKKQGQNLIKKATNPITKKAAQVTADKLVKEAEGKAKVLNTEADKNANKIVSKAKTEADKIIADANAQIDKL